MRFNTFFYRYTIGQTMTPEGGVTTQLNISHIRVDDGGLYSCVAHHADNIVAHEDRVNVYGKHNPMTSLRSNCYWF